MIQLLAGAFLISVYGVIAQRLPLDTTVPITRIAPPLRRGDANPDNFGFAVALYQLDPAGTNLSLWRVVVGAPNGSYPGGLSLTNPSCSTPTINNTGLVYLCSIQPGKDTCDGAVGNGTVDNGRLFDCQAPSNSPNYQQTGASLYSSGGYLIACAPGFSTGSYSQPVHRGTCYVSFNNSLRTFAQIFPCRSAPVTTFSYYDETYCYAGLSVALKNKIAMFGNPLAFTTGMASYLQLDTPPVNFSMIAPKNRTVSTGGLVYGPTTMNINGSIVYKTNTLKGYSVGIGRITRSNVSDYLVATPRWSVDNYVGTVEVFAFPNTGAPLAGPSYPVGNAFSIGVGSNSFFNTDVGVYNSLMNVAAYGTQSGEQFGASMDTADLDQDGYDELIVGAPFYTDYTKSSYMYEVGRVYVFQNTKGNLSATPIILSSPNPFTGGRFGHVVLSVGDINGDGTEDFAVGAPYESCTSSDGTSSTGSVYLYTGDRTTFVSQTPIQKITACDIRQRSLTALNNATLRSFGYSLASKADLDGNAYNDLAVGAFESRAVFVLRTFSVANVTATLTNVGGGVSATKAGCNSSHACGIVMLCATYNCSSRPGSCSQSLSMTFDISESTGKAFFNTTTIARTSTVVVTANMLTPNCINVTFYSMLGQVDLSPFKFTFIVRDLSCDLVSDSGAALADFKAIPVLNGGSASINVGFARACTNPNACASQLALSQTSAVVFKDAQAIVEKGLIVNETTSITFTLTVNNSGDEVFGINLVLSAPSFVTVMTITKSSGVQITCTKTNTTGFVCPTVVDGFLAQGNASVLGVALTIDTTSIPFDASNMTFNVSSDDIETNTLDNVVTILLQPTASADLSILSESFSPSGTTYTTPKSITNPTNLGSIGLLTTFEVTFQRSGPTYIPSLTLTISLPLGGSDWSSYYLYPASVASSVSTIAVSCAAGVLNPYNLQTTKKRSLSADMIKDLQRGTRQAQNALVLLDCSQSSAGCKNLVCNITNITSTPSFSVRVSLYVNDKYFSARGDNSNFSVTAAATVSIPTHAIFTGIVSKSFKTAVLNISAAQQPKSTRVPLEIIIPPIVAVVVIIVIAVIVLYACGFFKRKKREDEDAVEGIDGAVATTAVTKKDPLEDSTVKM
ncbi:hypothetical protein EMCRGX_G012578 [Ephydatia muelleri]|eukprot:Em0004g131a